MVPGEKGSELWTAISGLLAFISRAYRSPISMCIFYHPSFTFFKDRHHTHMLGSLPVMLHGLVFSSLSRVVSSLIPRNLCPPHLPVDDDLHTHAVLLQQSLDGSQTHPQVVGVEHLELLDGLELIHMVLWYLYTEWIVTYTIRILQRSQCFTDPILEFIHPGNWGVLGGGWLG